MKYLLVFITSCITYAQQQILLCEQIIAIKELVQTHHYRPKPINNEFSKGIFHLFITNLDKNKDYFFEEDITALKADITEIDNYVLDNNCQFTSKYATILKKRYTDYNTLFKELKSDTIDYSGSITLALIARKKYRYFKTLSN